jgi:hypothetical protein
MSEGTLRVKLLTSVASEAWILNFGDVVVLARALAEELVSAGRAELTDAPVGPGPTTCAIGHENFEDWCGFCRHAHYA